MYILVQYIRDYLSILFIFHCMLLSFPTVRTAPFVNISLMFKHTHAHATRKATRKKNRKETNQISATLSLSPNDPFPHTPVMQRLLKFVTLAVK